jgi:hypothetical protein
MNGNMTFEEGEQKDRAVGKKQIRHTYNNTSREQLRSTVPVR